MMYLSNALKSCGICEIHGLQEEGAKFDPEELFKWIMKKYNYTTLVDAPNPKRQEAGRGAYIMTLAYVKEGNGMTKRQCSYRVYQLRKYITNNNLGKLIVLPDVGNPNYHNKHVIRTMVFAPDQEAMLKFCKEKGWGESSLKYFHTWWITGV